MDSSIIKQEICVLIKEEIDLDDNCQLSSEGELVVPKSPNECDKEFVPVDVKSEPEEFLVDIIDSSDSFDFNSSPQIQDHNRDSPETDDGIILSRENRNLSRQMEAMQGNSPSLDSASERKRRKSPRREACVHQCDLCPKSFKKAGNLKTHLLVHSGVKSHHCTVCGKSFNKSGSLKRHLLLHSGEKQFQCETCLRRFTHLGNLQKHALTHSGAKPHACTVCPSRFTQSGTLKRHMQMHLGDRSHRCEKCGKSFTESGNLKRHVFLVHSGDRTHKCRECYRRFTDGEKLRKHLARHAGSDVT